VREEIKVVAPTLCRTRFYCTRRFRTAPVVRACRQARLKTSPYLNARGKAVRVVEGHLVCGAPADVDEAGGNACYGGRDR
jgi:hypothetical protein